jgi:hypothetical protein
MERYVRRAGRDASPRRLITCLVVLALLPLLASCGGDKPPVTPTPTTFTLTVAIRAEVGQQPVTGALVRIIDGTNAGRNATSDQSGNAVITGLSSGSFNIEVTAAGFGQLAQPVTLSANQTVTVAMKLTPNPPPVIAAIVAKGALQNEPANYSDAGEALTVTANVSDAETTPDKLTYEWKADSGTFTGTGQTVKWQPSTTGGSGGASAMINLTVIEKYGPGNAVENKASASQKVVIHDSRRESGDLVSLFLNEFSNSTIPADQATRNFSSASYCGKTQETSEIADNRAKYSIDRAVIGSPLVTLNFSGTCFGMYPGDACVTSTCEWWSKIRATGVTEHVSGSCNLTTIYDSGRDAWRLCISTFSGKLLPSGRPATDFIR